MEGDQMRCQEAKGTEGDEMDGRRSDGTDGDYRGWKEIREIKGDQKWMEGDRGDREESGKWRKEIIGGRRGPEEM
jgi:hypothetical protein